MNERHKIDTIIAYICHAFMVGREAMLSRKRTQRVSWARHAFCKVMCDYYGMNDGEISRFLERNRHTATYCRITAESLVQFDRHFRLAYEQVCAEIRNNPTLAAQ